MSKIIMGLSVSFPTLTSALMGNRKRLPGQRLLASKRSPALIFMKVFVCSQHLAHIRTIFGMTCGIYVYYVGSE